MNIVVVEKIEVSDKIKARLRELGAEMYEDLPNEAEIVNRVTDAEIITTDYAPITKSIIDAAPNLKFIVVTAVGYNAIDVAHAASKGVKVLNCPTWCSSTVAEMALAMMFALQRKLIPAHNDLASGSWLPETFMGSDLGSKKLGMIGYGNIGKEIMKKCSALGMQTSYVNSRSGDKDWDSLLTSSDIICIGTPLNESTHHLLDEHKLKQVKPNTVIINIGRGALIDTSALIAALDEERIAGAGLDVFEDEPRSGGKPNADILNIASRQNVVVAPHIGSTTIEAHEKLAEEMLANIESCLANQPQNVVN